MSLFHTHLLLPLAEPDRHAGLPFRLRTIRRFERMTEKAQRQDQQQRLQHLLQHAYDTVPYYRQQFDDAAFKPSNARVDRPLPLPVLTRSELLQRSDELVSSAFPKSEMRISATGGTTNTPINFYRDLEGLRNKTALQLRLNSWAGYYEGDSVLTLWGLHRDLTMQPNWRWRLYEQTLLRRIPAPSGFITDEILERFRQRYERHRPKVIYAYTNVMVAFAAYLKEHGIRHRPETLIVTAELLSEPRRKFIESVFGRPVFNHYGSRDVGMIASECSEHEGLHFHPWSSYVEFDPIGDTPDGPAYRLLVTDLLNYGQPFIRYDTGDCVTLSGQRCRCGRWFPVAGKILGRVSEGIALADGGIIPGLTLGTQMAHMGNSFRSIARVQFVQKSLHHMHLRYSVKENGASQQSELESIRNAIDALMNQPMKWSLEQVSDIPRERSGKIRLCVSEISPTDSILGNTLSSPAAAGLKGSQTA